MQNTFGLNHVFNKLGLALCGIGLGCNFFVPLCAAPKKSCAASEKVVDNHEVLVKDCFSVHLGEDGKCVLTILDRNEGCCDLLNLCIPVLQKWCDAQIDLLRLLIKEISKESLGKPTIFGLCALINPQCKSDMSGLSKNIEKIINPSEKFRRKKAFILSVFVQEIDQLKYEAKKILASIYMNGDVFSSLREQPEFRCMEFFLQRLMKIDRRILRILSWSSNSAEPGLLDQDPLENITIKNALGLVKDGEPQGSWATCEHAPEFAELLDRLLKTTSQLLALRIIQEILNNLCDFVNSSQNRTLKGAGLSRKDPAKEIRLGGDRAKIIVNVYAGIFANNQNNYFLRSERLSVVFNQLGGSFSCPIDLRYRVSDLIYLLEILSIISVYFKISLPLQMQNASCEEVLLEGRVRSFLTCYQDWLTNLGSYPSSELCMQVLDVRLNNRLLLAEKECFFSIISDSFMANIFGITEVSLGDENRRNFNRMQKARVSILAKAEHEKQVMFDDVCRALDKYYAEGLARINAPIIAAQHAYAKRSNDLVGKLEACVEQELRGREESMREEQQQFNAFLSQYRDYYRRLTFVAALQEADDLEEEIEPCVSEKTYRSVFHLSAKNDLQEADLGEDLERQIRAKLESVPEMGSNLVLSGFGSLYRRLRVGNYRVIYRINGKIVHVIACYRRAVAYGQDLYNRLGSFESDLRLVEQ